MTNGGLAQTYATVGPMGTKSYPVIISPAPYSIIEMGILSIWQNPCPTFLTFGVRAVMAGKTKWKPLKLLLSRKLINPKQHHIPGVIVEISATHRTKDAGCVFSRNPTWPARLACAESRQVLKNDRGFS